MLSQQTEATFYDSTQLAQGSQYLCWQEFIFIKKNYFKLLNSFNFVHLNMIGLVVLFVFIIYI